MKALVVGQGSIGQRHARLLSQAHCDVAVVSRTPSRQLRSHADLATAVVAEKPGYIVIANATAEHHASLATLVEQEFTGAVLVEKPLFDQPRPAPFHRFARLAVAYNLRFHPVLVALKQRLAGQRVLSVEAYAGQWLPDWRPGTDHRTSYSASATRGGGVLRDLSHELDLVAWLFGPWSHLAALGGRQSTVTFDSDDLWTVLLELASGAAVTLQLNYLDRPGRRRLLVVTPDATHVADVAAATLTTNGTATHYEVDRDDTYRAEHAAMIANGPGEPCTLGDGLAVLETIAAIEHAARNRTFVERTTA
jgi:predicted dehydrogenase